MHQPDLKILRIKQWHRQANHLAHGFVSKKELLRQWNGLGQWDRQDGIDVQVQPLGRREEGLRLASALVWFWQMRSRHFKRMLWLKKLLDGEAVGRADQPLAAGSQSDSHLLVWIWAVNAIFFLNMDSSGQFLPGDDSSLYSMEQIKTMQEENIVLCRAIGEPASGELAQVLMLRGYSPGRKGIGQYP